MVVIHDGPIKAEGSYDLPLQPVGPFMMLEYVSKGSKRKDYEENHEKYEKQLKVPYYLLFYPDAQELTLFHHTGEKFVSVKPNDKGRLAIPELELEAAILDGWVRYWFRGELLPLPADLMRELQQTKIERDDAAPSTEGRARGNGPTPRRTGAAATQTVIGDRSDSSIPVRILFRRCAVALRDPRQLHLPPAFLKRLLWIASGSDFFLIELEKLRLMPAAFRFGRPLTHEVFVLPGGDHVARDLRPEDYLVTQAARLTVMVHRGVAAPCAPGIPDR